MYRMSKKFASLSTCKPAGDQKSQETRIYEELLDLMELAGKITEIRVPDSTSQEDADKSSGAYMHVLNLDRQLQTWYRRLPDALIWKPENIQTAPFSFFLLHQQYHCSLILLHRPWAKYEDPAPPNSDDGHEDDAIDDSHAFMSRSICTKQAIRVARIFWHHRQRFNIRLIFVTGIQHAGTAATALVAALASIKSASDRKTKLPYLECLASALHDMSATYQPAASMSSILQAVMQELQSNEPNSRPSPRELNHIGASTTIPARRESSSINEGDPDPRFYKKQQTKQSFPRPPNANIPAPSLSFAPTPQSLPPPTSASCQQFNLLDGMLPPADIEGNGYVVITPQSDRAGWPNLSNELNVLDHPMSYTWMGPNQTWTDLAENPMIGENMSETMEGEEQRNTKLDFFSF